VRARAGRPLSVAAARAGILAMRSSGLGVGHLGPRPSEINTRITHRTVLTETRLADHSSARS
jgi:hypothetical protein